MENKETIKILKESNYVKDITIDTLTFARQEGSILLNDKIFNEVLFKQCTFELVGITDTIFKKCKFKDCIFIDANLGGCVLDFNYFTNCQIGQIHFYQVSFLRSNTSIESKFLNSNDNLIGLYFENVYDLGDFALSFRNSSDKIDMSDNNFMDHIHITETLYSRIPEGKSIGWKVILAPKTYYATDSRGNKLLAWNTIGRYLIKLQIPSKAKRSSWYTNECRASYIKVLDIIDQEGKHYNSVEATSMFDNTTKTIYTINQKVYADDFDENPKHVCSHGIHFFINKQEAMDYGEFKFKK